MHTVSEAKFVEETKMAAGFVRGDSVYEDGVVIRKPQNMAGLKVASGRRRVLLM